MLPLGVLVAQLENGYGRLFTKFMRHRNQLPKNVSSEVNFHLY